MEKIQLQEKHKNRTEAEIKEINKKGEQLNQECQNLIKKQSHKLKIDPLIDKLTKIKESTPTFRMDTSKEDVGKYLLNKMEKGSTFQEESRFIVGHFSKSSFTNCIRSFICRKRFSKFPQTVFF